jgi:hypothetical protein
VKIIPNSLERVNRAATVSGEREDQSGGICGDPASQSSVHKLFSRMIFVALVVIFMVIDFLRPEGPIT